MKGDGMTGRVGRMDGMGEPENTTARDPFMHLLGAMSDGPDRYITDMESAGQRQIVNSDTLPSEAPWDELAALGFVKGEPVSGDDLFVHCTLPDGWKREGSDHAMWSNIVDERGVRRVAVFYKAAFYDRSAAAHIPDVGYSLSTEAIYGDEPPALPAQWGVLTTDERASFVGGLTNYLEKAEECPQVYADRVPKVRGILALAQP